MTDLSVWLQTSAAQTTASVLILVSVAILATLLVLRRDEAENTRIRGLATIAIYGILLGLLMISGGQASRGALLEWTKGAPALLGAVGALVGAVGNIIAKLFRASPHRQRAVVVQEAVSPWHSTGVITLALLFVATVILAARLGGGERLPPNARMMVSAFDALNGKDWTKAFEQATDCVNTFGPMAESEEGQLEASETPEPPNGKVPPGQKDAIVARGVLNDVGACSFIQGQAAERLGRPDDARRAYEAAAQLKYARVYDPYGDFFWSPAEAASGRLRTLR